MKTTRRNFLKTGSSAIALSAGILALPSAARGFLGANAAGKGSAAFDAISLLNKLDFENQIGTFFKFGPQSSGQAGGMLTEVRDVLQGGSEKNRIHHTHGFSLLFTPVNHSRVLQDVYFVEHASLGYFYILMSPVRTSRRNPALCFEAVINRFV